MIRLLFFARLRELLDCNELELETVAGESVAQLAQRIVDQRGDVWQILLHEDTRCAINQEVVDYEATISDGDELAFFPPVTGG